MQLIGAGGLGDWHEPSGIARREGAEAVAGRRSGGGKLGTVVRKKERKGCRTFLAEMAPLTALLINLASS